MATLSSFLEAARYDLVDYESGVEFEDRELINYLNRMINLIDSTLLIMRSDVLHGTETNLDTVASQNYVDLTNLNNGHWDSIREVWIGDDRKEHISVPFMYYKRKFYSGDAEPQFFAVEGNRIIFETGADSAHTDLVIHYNKKTRPRLEDYSETFTVDAANNDIQVASGAHTFITGDGIFTLTTSAADLPSGLAESTNYWSIFDPANPADFMLASSINNALDETAVTISDAGTGTHTIALTEYTPYNGMYDDFLREMLVMHAKGKREGQTSRPDAMFQRVFRKRLFEEEVRRGFQEPAQWLGF